MSLFDHVSILFVVSWHACPADRASPVRESLDSLSVGLHSVEVCAATEDSRERPAAMRQARCILLDITKVYEGVLSGGSMEVKESVEGAKKRASKRGWSHDSKSI